MKKLETIAITGLLSLISLTPGCMSLVTPFVPDCLKKPKRVCIYNTPPILYTTRNERNILAYMESIQPKLAYSEPIKTKQSKSLQ